MGREMIKGAKYSWGGKWFTFVRPHATWKNYGWFRDDAGQMLTIRSDVFDAANPKEPAPFPEPERWHLETLHQNPAIVCRTHNATVDQFMREIRRLEALTNKK